MADNSDFIYLGSKLINPVDGSYFSQEDIALLLNEIVCKKKLYFTDDERFQKFVNETLDVILENTKKKRPE